MNGMIVLRLEGDSKFLLVDPTAGTVRPIDAEDAAGVAAGASTFSGVAEAYALPAMPSIPSRKFYIQESGSVA